MEYLVEIILLAIVFGIIGTVLIWGIYTSRKWKNFRKYLKVGDFVDCYLVDERKKYELVSLGDIYCEIKDKFGGYYKVQRTEIYPNLRTRYRKSYNID